MNWSRESSFQALGASAQTAHKAGEYYAWAMTGLVVGLETWSEPDFGGVLDPSADGTGAIRIASRMVERHKFFLRQRDGREVEVTLDDTGMMLRNGHLVTAVWAAKRGAKHGFCVLVENHTTGAGARIPNNISFIRPKVGLLRTAKFGLLATIPAALAMIMWLLIPGSLSQMDLNTFFLGATVALVALFIVGLVVAKLVLDYLQADDDQKIWQAAEDVAADVRASLRRAPQARR